MTPPFSIQLLVDADRFRRELRPATHSTDRGMRTLCEDLNQALSLRVSGFGEERWELSGPSHLHGFLAELPTVLPSLRDGKDASLAFRGLGRTLRFSHRGESLWVRADVTPAWRPSPSSALVNLRAFVDSLAQVVRTFDEAVASLLPECADDLELVEWRVRCLTEYLGPPDPEPFRAMWTTERHLWELRDRGGGRYAIVQPATNAVLLIENELTAVIVARNMRAAGVPVIPKEVWVSKVE